MPDINPVAGDLIEVTLYSESNGAPTIVLANITTRDKSEKWSIELKGIPPMRGLIEISNYEWKPDLGRWITKPEQEKPKPKLSKSISLI
jgi:hypothetical protein